MLDPGKKAPAFTLADQSDTKHALKDYAGRPLVLFFYPKDGTSGCTTEACDFRDLLPEFEEMDAAVLGISILDTKSKAKFAKKHDLSYPLLADDRIDADERPDPEVAQKYGVWVEKSMYGKTYMGIERTTFLIDAAGKIAQVWSKVKVPGHAEAVRDAVAELASAESRG
ncbi:MAG: peroxiredoxin [Planctomycetota bacterium]